VAAWAAAIIKQQARHGNPAARLAMPKRENRMNKEFVQDWDEPHPVTTGNTAAEPKYSGLLLKQIVTIRLDVDMLTWFKSAGPGYQTRINQILRAHMEANRGEATPAE
jgi:uncharacterized protein (DUF4415 family)